MLKEEIIYSLLRFNKDLSSALTNCLKCGQMALFLFICFIIIIILIVLYSSGWFGYVQEKKEKKNNKKKQNALAQLHNHWIMYSKWAC